MTPHEAPKPLPTLADVTLTCYVADPIIRIVPSDRPGHVKIEVKCLAEARAQYAETHEQTGRVYREEMLQGESTITHHYIPIKYVATAVPMQQQNPPESPTDKPYIYGGRFA